MSGLDDGCTRVVHEITKWCTSGSGARDWRMSSSGARDGCTRVGSGARVVHEIMEWCTRVVHESSTLYRYSNYV